MTTLKESILQSAKKFRKSWEQSWKAWTTVWTGSPMTTSGRRGSPVAHPGGPGGGNTRGGPGVLSKVTAGAYYDCRRDSLERRTAGHGT